MRTLCLIIKEMLDLAGRAVVRNDDEALIIHVKNEILALYDTCWDTIAKIR